MRCVLCKIVIVKTHITSENTNFINKQFIYEDHVSFGHLAIFYDLSQITYCGIRNNLIFLFLLV